MLSITSFGRRALRFMLRPIILDVVNSDIRVWGDRSRLTIAKSAHMVNTLFNLSSGSIVVGELTFAGHNVSIITGTHDYTLRMEERMHGIPREGRDIHIGKGVWIGSNVTILGPCEIGDHAVIAAGSLVRHNVPAGTIVAGVPAKQVANLNEKL
jgi:acetyltransferase-like isoleucine patch superfamily enzyme